MDHSTFVLLLETAGDMDNINPTTGLIGAYPNIFCNDNDGDIEDKTMATMITSLKT